MAPRNVRSALAIACFAAVAGCNAPAPPAAPEPRAVRTMIVEAESTGRSAVFIGVIEPQDRVALSFRIAGRVETRPASIGMQVRADQVVATLAAENELNALRAARASLASTRSELRQADDALRRQELLLARSVVPQADVDVATQARRAALSAAEAAEARLRNAELMLGFTQLKADAPGVVTAVGAEAGEVVSPGRMIVQLARREGRDAVFDVPGDVLAAFGPDQPIDVQLPGAAAVQARGLLREVAPQADPVTRMFRIRVGLTEPPVGFRLGTTVQGTVSAREAGVVEVPASALVRAGEETSVWVVDPTAATITRRRVVVARSDLASAVVTEGLRPGDIVVTAGVASLREGQRVRLEGSSRS